MLLFVFKETYFGVARNSYINMNNTFLFISLTKKHKITTKKLIALLLCSLYFHSLLISLIFTIQEKIIKNTKKQIKIPKTQKNA